MFQRVGAAAMKFDLSNTWALCDILENPHSKFKSIHIAGTNGKGSTSHMLASVFQSAGYKTGLYTSPHLKSFTERIRINGKEISEHHVIDFVNRIHPAIESLKPSFFEITVAMAFDYFAEQKVDMAIVEVGMGGRLDSTNVISPELSVITNIGWDHMDILGDSLEKIAEEKAGIIKAGIPVVISERQPEVEQVFEKKALAMNSKIYFAMDQITVRPHEEEGQLAFDIYDGGTIAFKNLVLPLQGRYQQKNIGGVLQALKLMEILGWKLMPEHIRTGLENVVSQTGLKGRWQVLNKKPFIVCDTGHNLDGITEVLKQIKAQTYRHLYFVFGMVKGKDVSAVLKLLPTHAYYFFCQPKIPRALDATVLCEQARDYDLTGEVIIDINEAIDKAKARADADDMIFIGGSTYVVAEIDNL
jgi:dihydrofolate synthase / folylpolyglutamate synthase